MCQERAPELPVGDRLQAGVVLQIDHLLDRLVLNLAQLVGVDLPGLEPGPGPGQLGRAQQAADVVGPERGCRALGQVTALLSRQEKALRRWP